MNSKPQILVIKMSEFKITVAGGSLHAPIFNFNDDKLKFNFNWTDNANENYGSASGFLLGESLKIKKQLNTGCFFYLRDLIHPPNILPIS